MDPIYADLSNAPLPTAATLRSRQSLARQVVAFLALNVRMLRVIAKGH